MQRVPRLEAGELLGDRDVARLPGEEGLQALGLVVVGRVEAQRGTHGAQQRVRADPALGELGGGTDETLVAAQLPQRGAPHAVHRVRELRVGEATQDLPDVRLLLLGREAVLRDEERLGLGEDRLDLGPDLGVGHRVRDLVLARCPPEVGCRGVARVDGEELPLDVRTERVDPRHPRDCRDGVAERAALDGPLEVGLDADVEAASGRLCRDNAVHRRVGEDRLRVHGILAETLSAGRGPHLGLEDVCGVDRVLARHDSERGTAYRPRGEASGDHRGHELEDVRAHGGRHDVGSRDALDELGLLRRGVDRVVAVHEMVDAAVAHLVHGVRPRGLERLDERRRHVGEDEPVACLVQEEAHEAAADVPRPEVDCRLAPERHAFTFPKMSSTSSTV